MIQAGLSIAIATDDPLIFDTTLSAELMLAQDEFDMSLDIVKAFNMTALQAMFLDARAKKALETELVDAYWGAEGSSA
jgi:adenosine deaminase